MTDNYEKWKAENPPRPDNEWERFVRQSQEIDEAIEKASQKED